MRFQTVVDLIDTISPLLTMGFGIFGATRDTKPKNGTLTKDGKIALWGVILSSCFTLLVKSGNLYNKNIQQAKANELQKIAAEKKRIEDSVNISFQKQVDSSFTKSIQELKDINSAAKENIEITKSVSRAAEQNISVTNEVNKASIRNIQLTQEVNKQTSGILVNTEKVLTPLFPFHFAVMYKVEAYFLDKFWAYMGKYQDTISLDDAFSNELTLERYLSYKDENPRHVKELVDLLNVTVAVNFFKQNSPSDAMSFYLHQSDTGINFATSNIFLDFSDRTLVVILTSYIEARSVIVITNNWKGDSDLIGSNFEITAMSRKNIQLLTMALDHGGGGVYLCGRCFFDFEKREMIPWKYEYKGTVELEQKIDMCVMQTLAQRMFAGKD
jgi:hypothetical protein